MMLGTLPFKPAQTPNKMLRNVEKGTPLRQKPESRALSTEANQLIERLLHFDPSKRPGAQRFDDLAEQPFFRGVAWNSLLDTPPPFKPELRSETDDRYFDPSESLPGAPSFASATFNEVPSQATAGSAVAGSSDAVRASCGSATASRCACC